LSFLTDWDLTLEEVDELITDNPSLRSFMAGYTAELKCRKLFFDNDERVSKVFKHDDHDRTKKGDICFTYRGHVFNIEVKSLQTNSIRDPRPAPKKPKKDWVSPYPEGTTKTATYQCDASDKREVVFKDGSKLATTCLLVGEFDLVAVNLHGFTGAWDFAFAKNADLPRVTGRSKATAHYTEYQKENLLATSMKMFNPMDTNLYAPTPWELLDEIILERAGAAEQEPVALIVD